VIDADPWLGLHPNGMFRRIVTREVKPKLLMIKGPLCWDQ
jgi:hypothetical protein